MNSINQQIAFELDEISEKGIYSPGMNEVLPNYAARIRGMREELRDVSQMKHVGERAKLIITGAIQKVNSRRFSSDEREDSSSEEEREDSSSEDEREDSSSEDELLSSEEEEQDHYSSMFASIYGVTEKDAIKYANKGYISPSELLEEDISEGTRNYIRFYEDFMSKIPRSEVEFLHRKVLDVILDKDDFEIIGNYKDGGPIKMIEIIIEKKPGKDVVTKLVTFLRKKRYLSRHHFEMTKSSYEGATKIIKGTPYRHIKITAINSSDWP